MTAQMIEYWRMKISLFGTFIYKMIIHKKNLFAKRIIYKNGLFWRLHNTYFYLRSLRPVYKWETPDLICLFHFLALVLSKTLFRTLHSPISVVQLRMYDVFFSNYGMTQHRSGCTLTLSYASTQFFMSRDQDALSSLL
jgi:hypothetical protein